MIHRLAITGPSGAGKTRLCARLASRGAAVVDADALGHAVLDDPAVRTSIVGEFGDTILAAGGTIDRAVLGPMVFAAPDRRQTLDDLVHPALAAACLEAMDRHVSAGSPLVILEAAVYFLLPGPPAVDMTVTVTAPPDLRLARLLSEGLTAARAQARLAAQSHLEPFWRGADRIVHNAGSEDDLNRAADDLWREFAADDTQEG